MFDWNCDYFIGKAVNNLGIEKMVLVDLELSQITAYKDLKCACYDLCHMVENGNRILLYQSPGILKIEMSPDEIFQEVMSGQNQGIKAYNKDNRMTYYRPYMLEVFNPKEMKEFRDLYYEVRGFLLELKNKKDPFQTQPWIN